MQTEAQRSPDRHMGGVALLFMGVTGIIGSGWLFASMYAAQIAGPAAVVSWAIGGFVAMTLALVYAELGGSLPVSGALARMPWFSHGNLSSFMAGWLSWMAYVSVAPIEVTAVLEFAGGNLPDLVREVNGNKSLSVEGMAVATGLLIFFTLVNLAGIRPAPTALCAFGFVLVGFVAYWVGWDTNWKVATLAGFGLVVFIVFRLAGVGRGEPLDLRSFGWFPPWLICTMLVSFAGNFGGGLGIIPEGVDLLVITAYSLITFFLALRFRLPVQEAQSHLKALGLVS